jgi:hypothetical protein
MGPGEIINGERRYFGICEGAAIMPGGGRAYKKWRVADIRLISGGPVAFLFQRLYNVLNL